MWCMFNKCFLRAYQGTQIFYFIFWLLQCLAYTAYTKSIFDTPTLSKGSWHGRILSKIFFREYLFILILCCWRYFLLKKHIFRNKITFAQKICTALFVKFLKIYSQWPSRLNLFWNQVLPYFKIPFNRPSLYQESMISTRNDRTIKFCYYPISIVNIFLRYYIKWHLGSFMVVLKINLPIS